MCHLNAKRGFTLLEISIVLLILSALTVIIYPVVQKRLMVREIDNAVREAQMVADYAESIRTRWLLTTSIDPVTGKYLHIYETTSSVTGVTLDQLPFGVDTMLPVNNFTGSPYIVGINYYEAYVTTIIGNNYSPAEISALIEQIQNNPFVVEFAGAPYGLSFTVIGRSSPSQIISQVGKSQFDKAFWYQEEIH